MSTKEELKYLTREVVPELPISEGLKKDLLKLPDDRLSSLDTPNEITSYAAYNTSLTQAQNIQAWDDALVINEQANAKDMALASSLVTELRMYNENAELGGVKGVSIKEAYEDNKEKGLLTKSTEMPTVNQQSKLIAGQSYTISSWAITDQGFNDDVIDLVEAVFNQSQYKGDKPFVISINEETPARIIVTNNWDGDTSRDTYIDDLANILEKATTEFILTSASESKAEAYQLIETLGKDIFYAIGERPMMATFRGRLLNTKEQDWKRNFEELYDDYLRASKLLEKKQRVYIIYDRVVVEGIILQYASGSDAGSPNDAGFSFSMYVTNRRFVGR